MRIDFDCTQTEIEDAYKRRLINSPTARSSYRRIERLAPVLAGLVLALAVPATLVWRLVAGVLGLVLFAVLTPQIIRRGRDQMVSQMVREQMGAGPTWRITIDLVADGLTIAYSGITVIRDWRTVAGVEETENAAYLRYCVGGGMTPIPARAFGSAQQRAEFIELATRYQQQAREEEAGDTATHDG